VAPGKVLPLNRLRAFLKRPEWFGDPNRSGSFLLMTPACPTDRLMASGEVDLRETPPAVRLCHLALSTERIAVIR